MEIQEPKKAKRVRRKRGQERVAGSVGEHTLNLSGADGVEPRWTLEGELDAPCWVVLLRLGLSSVCRLPTCRGQVD